MLLLGLVSPITKFTSVLTNKIKLKKNNRKTVKQKNRKVPILRLGRGPPSSAPTSLLPHPYLPLTAPPTVVAWPWPWACLPTPAPLSSPALLDKNTPLHLWIEPPSFSPLSSPLSRWGEQSR